MTFEEYKEGLRKIEVEKTKSEVALLKQFCNANNPYKIGDDPKLQTIAVLHDVLEDCPNAERELNKLELSSRIKTSLFVLNHGEESYEDYIKIIRFNLDATIVKLADLRDNSNITRLKGLRAKDFDRLEKYHKAYTYLQN